jgi:hypothetical protein
MDLPWRFTITYAVEQLAVEEVEKVGFQVAYREVCKGTIPALERWWNIMQDGRGLLYQQSCFGLWHIVTRLCKIHVDCLLYL